jgi:hypothetical protein
MHISQIKLISQIAFALEKQGVENINPRQMNAIKDAANIIVAAIAEDHRPAPVATPIPEGTPAHRVIDIQNQQLSAWLQSDDTGMSSEFLAMFLAPLAGLNCMPHKRNTDAPVPLDADDFGRCYRLFAAVPCLLPFMTTITVEWPAPWRSLAANWTELMTLYESPLSVKSAEFSERLDQLNGRK